VPVPGRFSFLWKAARHVAAGPWVSRRPCRPVAAVDGHRATAAGGKATPPITASRGIGRLEACPTCLAPRRKLGWNDYPLLLVVKGPCRTEGFFRFCRAWRACRMERKRLFGGLRDKLFRAGKPCVEAAREWSNASGPSVQWSKFNVQSWKACSTLNFELGTSNWFVRTPRPAPAPDRRWRRQP
jgi:hypothetical protein